MRHFKNYFRLDSFNILNWTDLRTASDYSGRVEYSVNEQNHVSFKLSSVMKRDEQEYCLRIITNEEKQRYLGRPGVTLHVTDLHIESPGEVTEGESAVLTCKTTCNIQKNQQLHLQTVSSEDAGSYSCAVRGSEHLPSTAQTLRVDLNPPKSVSVNVSVSNSSSGEMVNLTCSSDANPPVEIYTWFKEGGDSPVGSGHSYVPLQSGSYYCQAQNQHGAQRSAAVSVLFYCSIQALCWWLVVYVGKFFTFSNVLFIFSVLQNVMRETRPPHNDDDDDDDDDDILDYENVPVSSTLAETYYTFPPCRNQKFNQLSLIYLFQKYFSQITHVT
uniref:Ig-like domain-containing protein n=1 Tax=Astyanax mexicanus TaxID=7994 RepID=A0A3B1JAV3_ASTMX